MLKLTTSKPRACDTCRSAASTVYCRHHSAFLCAACDAQIHASSANHERVWVCEACEHSPSAYRCKADAASLCVSCDLEIHSANPLARRHHRVPVVPIHGQPPYSDDISGGDCKEEDDELTESWLMMKNGGGEDHTLVVDEFLDLEEYGNNMVYQTGDNGDGYNGKNDSVVPFAGSQGVAKDDKVRQCWFRLGLEFDGSSNGGEYGCYSMNDSTVVSSLPSTEVGVVPESQRPPKGIIDLFMENAVEMPTQLSPSEREARVLRYREKKKMRKFEKTIRYASRKAYAETRPRIKGRFAKRTDVGAEVDQMFSNDDSVMAEVGYGIVPSF